jgi:hypothetical protein
MMDESSHCTHPHDALHPGRINGTTTVCLKCKQVVAIMPSYYLNGKPVEVQYAEMLERLQALPLRKE